MYNRVVNTSDIADILGISEREIQLLSEKGVIHKIERGRYDLKLSIQGYNRMKDAMLTNRKSTYSQERTRQVKIQADMLQLELEKKMENLLPADLVEAAWKALAIQTRTKIMSISGRIRFKMPDIPERVITFIDDECRAALKEHAEDEVPAIDPKYTEKYKNGILTAGKN